MEREHHVCYYLVRSDPTLYLDAQSSLVITFLKMTNLNVRIYAGMSRLEAVESIVENNEMPQLLEKY